MPRTNPNFMNGVPQLLVLELLAEKDSYGYELVRRVRERTGAELSLGEGVVYPVLHALERAGHLKTRTASVRGRDRLYYSITAKGKKQLQRIRGEWARIRSAVELVIGGGNDEG